jgi:hypothetical protein
MLFLIGSYTTIFVQAFGSEPKGKAIFLGFLFSIFILGIQFDSGWDYAAYRNIYASATNINYAWSNGVEPAYFAFTKLFSEFGFSYDQFILFQSIIFNILLFLAVLQFRQYRAYIFALLFASFAIRFGLSTYRQAFAVLFVFIAAVSWNKKRYFQSLFLFFTAISIHFSAFIFIFIVISRWIFPSRSIIHIAALILSLVTDVFVNVVFVDDFSNLMVALLKGNYNFGKYWYLFYGWPRSFSVFNALVIVILYFYITTRNKSENSEIIQFFLPSLFFLLLAAPFFPSIFAGRLMYFYSLPIIAMLVHVTLPYPLMFLLMPLVLLVFFLRNPSDFEQFFLFQNYFDLAA